MTVASTGTTEEAILSWARANMASYKRPRYVRILPEMPRTDVGKTARGALAERARAELTELRRSES